MQTRFLTAIILLAILPLRASADDARLAVPGAEEQARLRQAVQSQYSDMYLSTARADELALSKLLRKSATGAETAGQEFALLCESRDAAARAGDLQSAEEICKLLSQKFNLTINTARASLFKAAAETIADSDVYFAMLTKATDAALLADDFEPARQMLETGTAAAASLQATQWQSRLAFLQRKFDAQATAYAAVKPALDALREDPADPQANTAFGEYSCFVKNDWKSGLAMLERGTDKFLGQLAELDLKDPEDPASQIQIADGWADMAVTIPDYALAVHLRAYDWNVRALPSATMPDQRKHVEEQLNTLIPLVQGERETPTMWLAIGDALSRRAYVTSRIAGGTVSTTDFMCVPKEGALLIGFRVGFAMLGDKQVITYLQPIFNTPTGEQVGPEFGKQYSKLQTFRAPAGYAIGSMRSCGGAGLNSITPTYMRIEGDHLNRDDAIQSLRIGGPGGVLEIQDGQGTPVIGITGKQQDGYLGIGLVYSHQIKED